MSVSEEKIGFLQGLAVGLGVDDHTPQGKLTLALIDALVELSREKEQLESRVDKLGNYMDEMDVSLGDLVDAIAGPVDEAEVDGDAAEDADEEGAAYEFNCPRCGEPLIYAEADFDPDAEHICPYCRKSFLTGDIELEDDAEEEWEPDDEDAVDSEDEILEFECPKCGALLLFSVNVFNDEQIHTCPECGAELFEEEE